MPALPFAEPGGDVAANLDELAPIPRVRPKAGPRTGSDPAQLLQAIVGQLARQMVERVAQEMDITALPGSAGQDFADRLL